MDLTVADQDAELAGRAAQGDRAALEALARRYYPAVRSFLARRLDARDAEDAAQEVFLRVTRALETYRPEFRFSTWLFQVALNCARDVVRRRGAPERPLPPPAGAPLITADEDRARLDAALRRLPADLAEPLLLVYQRQMPHAEAAEILGLTTAAVKMRVHRAIRQMRALLREEER